MNPTDAENVARMAAQQMGAPAPGAAQPVQQPAQPPAPQEAPTTDQEKAAEQGSPQTEGDRTSQEPVLYKVKIGDSERELTEAQIAQSLSRYAELNHRHAQNKPVMDLVDRLVERSGAQPDQVAKLLEASLKAFTKNATFGGQQPPSPNEPGRQPPRATPAGNMDDEFRKYEEENAISLPPGYRETMDRLGRMEQALMANMGIMQRVLGQARQSGQAGMQAAQSAQQDRQSAVQKAIATNLDLAQEQYGLANEDAGAFMAWAGERGYTLEDFADGRLTMKIVGDFAATRNTPEFERLKSLAQRRSAVLEAGAPGAAAGAPASPMAGDDTLDRLGQQALSRRIG